MRKTILQINFYKFFLNTYKNAKQVIVKCHHGGARAVAEITIPAIARNELQFLLTRHYYLLANVFHIHRYTVHALYKITPYGMKSTEVRPLDATR